MRRRDFISLIGSAGVLPFSAVPAWAQSAEMTAPTSAERMAIADDARGFMGRYSVPGFSMAVGHSGRIIYQDAFGFADRDTREAVTPAHAFRIASVSKPITSATIFTLIEAGR